MTAAGAKPRRSRHVYSPVYSAGSFSTRICYRRHPEDGGKPCGHRETTHPSKPRRHAASWYLNEPAMSGWAADQPR